MFAHRLEEGDALALDVVRRFERAVHADGLAEHRLAPAQGLLLQRQPLPVQDVERLVGDRHPSRQALGFALVGCAQALLEAAEFGPSALVEGHDLAVEHQPRAVELAADGLEFGVLPGDVPAVAVL